MKIEIIEGQLHAIAETQAEAVALVPLAQAVGSLKIKGEEKPVKREVGYPIRHYKQQRKKVCHVCGTICKGNVGLSKHAVVHGQIPNDGQPKFPVPHGKTVTCQECGRKMKKRGLSIHLSREHLIRSERYMKRQKEQNPSSGAQELLTTPFGGGWPIKREN